MIDTVTGEVIERRLGTSNEAVLAFVDQITVEHGELLVTYEAGPTGFVPGPGPTPNRDDAQIAAPTPRATKQGPPGQEEPCLILPLDRNALHVGAAPAPRPPASSIGQCMAERHHPRQAGSDYL